MNDHYDKAFDYVMELEGILSNHPRDPGGLTAWGITKRDHPDLFANGRMPTRDEAKRVYVERGYWKPIFERLVSERIACELFEAGVLCGRRTSTMFCQTAHNYLADWSWSNGPLKIDGAFGPVTLQAVNGLCALGYETALYRAMNVEQGIRFKTIGHPDFIRGWFNKRLN